MGFARLEIKCLSSSPAVMPAQARLSWEAAAFSVCTVWWVGHCAGPPAVGTCFCEIQGVLLGRKRVLECQEVRFVPVMCLFPAHRLLLYPVPARSSPKSSRDEASVLQGTLIRHQILALCFSVGQVAETKNGY